MDHHNAAVRHEDGDPIGYFVSGMDDPEAQQQEVISRTRDAIAYCIQAEKR